MRNSIIIISVFLNFICYSQVIETDSTLNILDLFNNPDTLYNPDDLKVYFSDRDTVQYYTEVDPSAGINFIDTLTTNKFSIFEYGEQKIFNENDLITFYNKEKLLVISSEKSLIDKTLFMSFEHEERYGVTLKKYFVGENEERIILSYFLVDDKKILNWISINDSTFTTIKTYYTQ